MRTAAAHRTRAGEQENPLTPDAQSDPAHARPLRGYGNSARSLRGAYDAGAPSAFQPKSILHSSSRRGVSPP